MTPRIWINTLSFSDGSELTFEPDDIVILVGPNNSGKSASLRGIQEKLNNPSANSPVLSNLSILKGGDPEDLFAWLDVFARKEYSSSPENPIYQAFGIAIHESSTRDIWTTAGNTLGNLSRFFCHFLTADERLAGSNPAQSIAIASEPLQHPIHYLLRDDRLELSLSRQFRKAFGTDLVVHRNAGSQVPLLVGERPIPKADQDRLSFEYIQELEKLSPLHKQGDGMRSFAGVLLHTSVGRESILLIDEPEAFLHPPQARLIGKMLVADKPAERQLFVATHSGDVLRGVLDANRTSVKVLRIRREEDINVVRLLQNDKIAELWNDPLLRYSNILDGLFHEHVIICESDSDARFYSAIFDANIELKGPDTRRPDVMFTHCGGKDRLALVVRALREVDVPISVVADFDILNNERPLKDIVEATGGDWDSMKTDWTQVKNAIESKKPELGSTEVIAEINTVLSSITDPMFPSSAKQSIQKIFRRSSPWSTAKEVGKSSVPSGQPTQAYERLMIQLKQLGIYVVEIGELEGFARSVGNHGPRWVNEVLKKDLKTDPELADARAFVASLLPE